MSIKFQIEELYQPQWLSTRRANALERTLAALTYREYAYRASVLKREPKREFYVPFADGSIPLYRWGKVVQSMRAVGLWPRFPRSTWRESRLPAKRVKPAITVSSSSIRTAKSTMPRRTTTASKALMETERTTWRRVLPSLCLRSVMPDRSSF